MIVIKDKKNCCGCGACIQICPKNAITMQEDSEGFIYPVADEKKCIKCGLCVKTCPILNNKEQKNSPKVYIAKNKNVEVQKLSSSGGIFSALADYILAQNGVVFGAAFNEKWEVRHCYIERKEDLDILRRSKYVQSNTLNTFKETKNFLEMGRKVLYTGTPCQIAGLKSFLGKNYDNLLTADIICHGVPSPRVWREFLKHNFDLNNIEKINFREKLFNWEYFFDDYILKDRVYKRYLKSLIKLVKINKVKRNIIDDCLYSPYLNGFLQNLFLRISCYDCKFKGNQYKSDFTLADAWGIRNICPDKIDQNGVSYIIVSTEKGQDIFDLVKDKITFIEISIDKIKEHNACIYKSVKPHPKREEFFKRYQREPLNKLIKEITRRPLWGRVCNKIKRVCKKVIKKI